MGKTSENLKAAFAGESQANRKYLAFADKALQEGYEQVARLFRAAAAAETVHAHSHLKVLEGVRSTAENLEEAISGENYEAEVMYPEFIALAEGEGDKRAVKTFSNALAAEKVHEAMYRDALENLENEADQYEYYVCPVCGHTHARFAPDQCPVCGVKGERFIHIP